MLSIDGYHNQLNDVAGKEGEGGREGGRDA